MALRIVFATGDEALDEYVSKKEGILEVGRALYAEQLATMVPALKPDVVLFSETIPISRFDQQAGLVGAEANILKIMESIVEEGIRVVMILNERPPGHPFLERLIGLGIYDLIIGDTIKVDQVIAALHHPGTRKQVKHLLRQEEELTSEDTYRAKEIRLITTEEEKPEGSRQISQRVYRIAKSMTDVSEKLRKKWEVRGKESASIPETTTVVQQAVVGIQKKEPETTTEKVIVLYSPEATGKTYVGVNMAIAAAKRLQVPVLYKDCTPTCKTKLWFNAPMFPFTLSDIPLTVAGRDAKPSAKVDVLIVEAASKADIPTGAVVYVVVDSDYARQVIISKSLDGIQPAGLIWNMAYEDACHPQNMIPLLHVLTLPYDRKAYCDIEKGIPRAFSDEALCDRLVKVIQMDPLHQYMRSGIG
jgi:putative lipoic acid-binding regulatory protein